MRFEYENIKCRIFTLSSYALVVFCHKFFFSLFLLLHKHLLLFSGYYWKLRVLTLSCRRRRCRAKDNKFWAVRKEREKIHSTMITIAIYCFCQASSDTKKSMKNILVKARLQLSAKFQKKKCFAIENDLKNAWRIADTMSWQKGERERRRVGGCVRESIKSFN